MTRATELIERLRRLGHKLDGPDNDADTMRYLLRCRRALYVTIEAARVVENVAVKSAVPKLYAPEGDNR